MAIADEAISIGPPTDVAGFASAAAIRVNVRAAQITGRITSSKLWDSGFQKFKFG